MWKRSTISRSATIRLSHSAVLIGSVPSNPQICCVPFACEKAHSCVMVTSSSGGGLQFPECGFHLAVPTPDGKDRRIHNQLKDKRSEDATDHWGSNALHDIRSRSH